MDGGLIYKMASGSDGSSEVTISIPTKAKARREEWPTYYATAYKGFITNDLWKSIIDSLINVIKPHLGGKHAL
jgi:hypothetical protein